MIITVAGPGAGRPIIVQIVQVFAVQTLRAGLLECRVALSLPLHRIHFVRLPIIGEVPGGAAGVPVRIILVRVVARVRIIVGRVLVPKRGRRHGHVHGFRLPVRVPVSVPAHRDPVVIKGALGQRVDVLVSQIAGRGVSVQALLVVHDTVHGILSPRLPDRAPAAGSSRSVP